jgi:hypothetical protein
MAYSALGVTAIGATQPIDNVVGDTLEAVGLAWIVVPVTQPMAPVKVKLTS